MTADLTAGQRTALDALTAKRRAFVLAYIGEAQGNATGAARIAGYSKASEEGHRLLKNAQVVTALEALRAPVEHRKILGIEELRAFWTRIATGEVPDVAVSRETGEVREVPAALSVRLRASELLGKSQGAFLD